MKYLKEAKKFLKVIDEVPLDRATVDAQCAIANALVEIAEQFASVESNKAKLAQLEHIMDLWLAGGLETSERVAELERTLANGAKKEQSTSTSDDLLTERINSIQSLPEDTPVTITIKRDEMLGHYLTWDVNLSDLRKFIRQTPF